MIFLCIYFYLLVNDFLILCIQDWKSENIVLFFVCLYNCLSVSACNCVLSHNCWTVKYVPSTPSWKVQLRYTCLQKVVAIYKPTTLRIIPHRKCTRLQLKPIMFMIQLSVQSFLLNMYFPVSFCHFNKFSGSSVIQTMTVGTAQMKENFVVCALGFFPQSIKWFLLKYHVLLYYTNMCRCTFISLYFHIYYSLMATPISLEEFG